MSIRPILLMSSLLVAGALILGSLASAQPSPDPKGLAPTQIVNAAPATDWVSIAPTDLLVMDLAPDAHNRPRRVIIQLMPPPFSQGWVGNVRKFAEQHWWDGVSVYRVQDNYVAQWGDPEDSNSEKAKPPPAGLSVVSEAEYVSRAEAGVLVRTTGWSEILQSACRGEGQADVACRKLRHDDPYAATTAFFAGWPIASDQDAFWPIHCYGMIGVARDLSPDTGSGSSLYVVIGQAPRQLDRNIALIGRVIDGMEHLSSLQRGPAPLGVYADPKERTPIRRVRLARELPTAEQPRFQYLSTASSSFAQYAKARALRHDAFFMQPAGGVDICNVPIPFRQSLKAH